MQTTDSYAAAVCTTLKTRLHFYSGVKFNLIFNELKFYHVCVPRLPPYLGHDIFQREVAFDIPLFIK